MNRLDLPWIRQRLAQYQPQRVDAELAPRRAAVAAILRSAADECCELLFIRRSRHEQDPWSGHMAFPGGQAKASDASPLETVYRETLEEVSIDLRAQGELLGQLDEIVASAHGRVLPLAIAPFVFLLTGDVIPRIDPREVEEVLWVPIPVLLDPRAASTVPYELGGQRYDLPCFHVSERVIWGLTYQMVMRLFAVLEWEPRR